MFFNFMKAAAAGLPCRSEHFLRLSPWAIKEAGGAQADNITERVHRGEWNRIPSHQL